MLPVSHSQAAESGGSSASHQQPNDQDDHDENTNLINVIHGSSA
jgi:hypothetical protein